jgi:hypothetical protein
MASHSPLPRPGSPVSTAADSTGSFVNIPALYRFTNWYDKNGKQREYACRVIRASSSEMTMYAPVSAVVGVRVMMICNALGNLQGAVSHVSEQGFAMQIAADQAQRASLAARISWHVRVRKEGITDKRKNARLVPKFPFTNLILPDSTCLKCFVIDVSVSGAAISAETSPAVGTPVAIGRIIGRVVRHFAGGFAVEFVERQDMSLITRKFLDAPPK